MILVDGPYIVTGQAILFAPTSDMTVVKTGQSSKSSDPQVSRVVLDNDVDVVSCYAVASGEECRLPLLVAHQAAIRPEPQGAGAVLMDRLDHGAIRKRGPIRFAKAAMIEDNKSAMCAHPQTPVTIFLQCGYQQCGQTIRDGVCGELAVLEPAETGVPRAYPDCVRAVLVDRIDVAVRQSLFLGVDSDGLPLQPIETLALGA